MNQIPNIEETEKILWCVERMLDGTYKTAEHKKLDILNYLKRTLETLHHQLQKARYCGKEFADGSICRVKLDCHLHDWRQREEIQKARQDWLREEIVRLEGILVPPYPHEGAHGDAISLAAQRGYQDALQTIIDRYHSELDQDKV